MSEGLPEGHNTPIYQKVNGKMAVQWPTPCQARAQVSAAPPGRRVGAGPPWRYILVFVLFPVQIAEAEMDVRFARRGFDGGFKFRYGFNGPAQAVESFSAEHVGGGGIGIALENLAELR